MRMSSAHIQPLLVVCFIFTLVWPCDTKVAVFYPVPAVSHIRYHTDMARALAKLGHETWVCIPDYLKQSKRIDISGIRVMYYGESLGNLEQRLVDERHIQEDFWEGHTFSPFDFFRLLQFTLKVMDETLSGGLYNKVKAVKPYLFIVDGISVMRNMLVIPYKLGIQFAFAGSVHDVVNSRVPFSPVATPSISLGYSDQMTFTERLHTVVTYILEFIAFRLIEEDMVAKYAPEMPYISQQDLAARAAIYLAETDPILDYPRPTLPNTKLIGATTAKDAKALREPYKSFVEKSEGGIAVATFGSAILNIPDKIFQKMFNAFNRSEVNVVWRVNATSPDKNKILTNTWIPQNDLLGHPKTKLFVSHCGKNGQYEALYHAVPILCLPIFADQGYNAQRVQVKGFGIQGDIREITAEELGDTLEELLTNTTYKTNIAKASEIFRLLYRSPMEEAAFWLDHVMVYGGHYMRASSQIMPLYQFLMLDIIALTSLVMVIFGLIVYHCTCCCCRLYWRERSPKTKKE